MRFNRLEELPWINDFMEIINDLSFKSKNIENDMHLFFIKSLMMLLCESFDQKLLSKNWIEKILKSSLFAKEIKNKRLSLSKIKIMFEYFLNQIFFIYFTKEEPGKVHLS